MKRSLTLMGLSLFLLSACSSAPTANVGTQETSSSSSATSSAESSASSTDDVPEVEANVDAEGNVVVE